MTMTQEQPIRALRRTEAMMVATFLSVPFLGLPMMIALCVEFLHRGLARSTHKVLDVFTLIGFLAAHVLNLALMYLFFSAGYLVLLCSASWLLHYAFCQMALLPKD